MKKVIGIIITIVSTIILSGYIVSGILAHYQLENTIGSYWSLADKASSIPKKAELIDKFVNALDGSRMTGEYNALWLKTPDNNFDNNLEMLKTLQTRLHEIQTMDVTSFQYQTAIQQITAQEQGEAHEILAVFTGVWFKVHHFFLWSWVCVIGVVIFMITLVLGIIWWNDGSFNSW
jgi:hypothetical protein